MLRRTLLKALLSIPFLAGKKDTTKNSINDSLIDTDFKIGDMVVTKNTCGNGDVGIDGFFYETGELKRIEITYTKDENKNLIQQKWFHVLFEESPFDKLGAESISGFIRLYRKEHIALPQNKHTLINEHKNEQKYNLRYEHILK